MNLFVRPMTVSGGRRIIGLCLFALAAGWGAIHHRTAHAMWDGVSETEYRHLSSGMLKVSGPLSIAEAERKRKTIRPPSGSEKLQITQAVQRSLIDAESARFGEILVLPNKYACVAVNARNRFGGYTCFQMAFAGMMEGAWHYLTTENVTFEKCISIIVNLK